MKKIIFVLSLLFLLPCVVLAQGQGQSQGQGQTSVSDKADLPPQKPSVTTSASQNQANDDQLKIQMQQQDRESVTAKQQEQNQARTQEDQTEEGLQVRQQSRNENAMQNMSQVATRVHEMVTSGQQKEGGIGQQVSQIAKNQTRSQEKISESLKANENRPEWLNFLLGPNSKAVSVLEEEYQENRSRLQQLESLRDEFSGEQQDLVDSFVLALEEENNYLQEQINTYQQQFSLFGWVKRFFIS